MKLSDMKRQAFQKLLVYRQRFESRSLEARLTFVSVVYVLSLMVITVTIAVYLCGIPPVLMLSLAAIMSISIGLVFWGLRAIQHHHQKMEWIEAELQQIIAMNRRK